MSAWRHMIAALVCVVIAAGSARAQDRLVFGVVPQRSAGALADQWVPLLDEIGKRMGVRIVFRTAPDAGEFERRMAAGEYDLVYGSAYHYLNARKNGKARAIARERRDEQGVLAVRVDSPITDLAELQGKVVAFPAKTSFGATLLTQSRLHRDNIEIQAKYVGSHDSVYRAVAVGAAEAGGGVIRTFNTPPDDLRDKLRVLYITPPFPAHPIFVLGAVKGSLVAHFQAVLFSLDADPIGAAVLRRAELDGIAPADEADYDAVRHVIDEVQP